VCVEAHTLAQQTISTYTHIWREGLNNGRAKKSSAKWEGNAEK